MIDTHCHLDVARFDADRDEVLVRAWEAGLTDLVVPAIGPDAWDALLTWPARDARLHVGLGIHPQLVPELDERDDERHLARLDELLGRGVAIAVGECGVDGATADLPRQVRLFTAQLELARKHRLPALVHCLRAQPALRDVLAKVKAPLPRTIVLHSYSGSAELTRRYVDLGCAFSFAGPVSFPDARRPVEALRSVPAELLLVETDAPDQSPHPRRGERNEPAHLTLVVDAIAGHLGRPAAEVAALTAANARRVLGLDSGASLEA